MQIEEFLGLLAGVRSRGKNHSAKCPAHGDRNASLSISASDDGRVLVHCFAGCSPAEVCGAIGLTVADLFPPKVADQSPEGQWQLRQQARQSIWNAALGVLAAEADVLLVGAGDILAGRMTESNLQRLSVAATRIANAQAALR